VLGQQVYMPSKQRQSPSVTPYNYCFNHST